MIASRILLSACALLAAASAARAQSASEPNDPATPGDYFAVHAAFDAWNAQHGGHWQLVYETEYGAGRFLYGGSTASAAIPANDAEFVELARAALEDTYPIHHIENATLVADEVMFLPLALAGSTDKMTVQFRQELAGVPVIRGFANVLFDLRGHVLSIDTTAMPALSNLSTSPAIDAQRAAEIAARLFQSDTRLAPTQVGAPELAIDPVLEGKFRRPVLVWRVDVQFAAADMDAEGFEYRIDAQTGRLSSREGSIHTWDVSGNVKSLATPGLFPDSATNPPLATDMPNLTVTSASGNANTDASGNFNIVGAAAPLTVTVKYVGPFATVTNTAGTNFTMSPSLAASSGNAIAMNSPAATFSTAETNAFYWTNVQRNWTRLVNPSDATHDFLAVANVNITSTCNAYYNGSSTNFYQAGGGCVNTAYSDVVMHETGHWMNDRYGSGNGSDGFGEGNADNFAMYVTDDPVLGHDFSGPGTYIRSGLNTRQFCGDSSPGCYGEVHADGEVLMGALWKVRARLKVGLGNAPGITAANVLFNAWMNAYNDGQIKTIIEKHWLTLDDNDGNLQNGTPNFAHINGGFVDQGFDLPYHTFSVTPIADTQDQIGPYLVQATIAAEFSTQVPSATVHYRVNGGAFATVAMSNSGGNAWTGAIPGHACSAFFDYYISATDGGGHTSVYPVGAPNNGQLHFAVANIIPIVTENFENGTNGWTHAQVATQDDWMISSQFPVTISYGNAGDPTTPAVSGTSIWGNDLGPPGFNGFYSANVSNYLRSPILDCTGFTGVNLKFNRWLTVEKSQYDHADVKVNGNIVWSNPFATDLLDTSWTPVVIDISQYADNNPSVQIEFSLVSDGGLQYGGWNIDDVQLIQYGQCGSSCPAPTNYCTAKTTSLGGTPVVGSNGTASLATNNFSVRLTGGPPQRHAICFWSDTTGATPYTGGFMCVGLPQRRMPATFTDSTGAASQSIPIDPSMVGTQRHYQWWFRDPPDPFHVGLSDALTVTFCN